MLITYKKICLFAFPVLLQCYSFAQTIPVTNELLNDYARREQLTDSVNPGYSFCIRPLHYAYLGTDTAFTQWNQHRPVKGSSLTAGHLDLLPLTFTQQYNSHNPYGWNDGAMIPARGYQLLLSTGIYAKLGHLSLQLLPELVYAENKDFETFSTGNEGPEWASYYQWLNKSDIPEKFGDGTYAKLFPGQSSIRYNTGSLSFGVSTENLWWGPGRHNSLVMSDNAPGFLHATINTLKPIETGIGRFEGQLIGGKLISSGIFPPDTLRVYNSSFLYQPKIDEWRYLTGFVFTWQPKWVKGLFLGYTKASYLYHSDISGIADILPLQGLIKSHSEKQNKKASLGSLFVRYVMPEEQTELYIEYGRNDRSADIINLLSDKDYPRGYIAGLRKLTNKRANGSQWEIAAEFTQLQLPVESLITQAKSWYLDDYVRQGFTNDGQVLGAGIGPGSNSQMIDISWVKGMKKLGMMLERVVRNNDYYYNAFLSTLDFERHWTDISTTFHADWDCKKFLFSAELGMIRSLNYEWWKTLDAPYFKDPYDFLNFHGKLSVVYRW